MNYPEHEKLAKVSAKSQAIGEFLEWLGNEKGVVRATYNSGDRLVPFFCDVQSLLAEYFEIDRDKLEQEKRAMLATLREPDAAGGVP